jgi:hypothetical protein
MKNAECRVKNESSRKARSRLSFCIQHSAFCVLHSNGGPPWRRLLAAPPNNQPVAEVLMRLARLSPGTNPSIQFGMVAISGAALVTAGL